VALSIVEVEHLVACAVVVWLQELLFGLFGLGLEVNYIWCDNQRCMKSLENLVVYDRSNHI
jgi:hypothetical protein